MKNISYDELLEFLHSDLNEVDFFNCDKSSLKSLRDYLLEQKERNKKYEQMINEPLNSIKYKNKWVKNIVPRYDGIKKGIIINGKNYPSICAGIDPKMASALGKNPTDYVFNCSVIISPLVHLKLKHRLKVLDNSQDEIKKIDLIAKELNYKKEIINTASNIFSINNSYYDICEILYGGYPVTRTIISSDEVYSVDYSNLNDFLRNKEKTEFRTLSLEDSKKLVKKLYISKK